MTPRLFIVIPCYNEQEVLPITAPMFLEKLNSLTAAIQNKNQFCHNEKPSFVWLRLHCSETERGFGRLSGDNYSINGTRMEHQGIVPCAGSQS